MPFISTRFIFIGWILLFFYPKQGFTQTDSVYLNPTQVLVLKDSIYIPLQDTVLLLPQKMKYRVRRNPYYTSDKFYDSLKTKSYRKALTRELYDLFFRSPPPIENHLGEVVSSESYFRAFEQEKINRIYLVKQDVLEGKVQDTTARTRTRLGRVVNRLHYSTREQVILKMLLFGEGDPVQPHLLADNERIIRSLNFIEDVRFYLRPDSSRETGVELAVVIKERFHWGVEASASNLGRYSVTLFNRNTFGTGLLTSLEYLNNSESSKPNGFAIRLGLEKYKKTLSDWELTWANNWQQELLRLDVSRDFISPYIKYGGGLTLSYLKDSLAVVKGDTAVNEYFERTGQDVWLGRSFILPGKDRRKNFILGLRYLHVDYLDRPLSELERDELFFNRNLVLSSLSFTYSRFIKDNFLLGFGITEDVPLGYRLTFTPGLDVNEFGNQLYTGVQFATAHYLAKLGFVGWDIQFGGFWKAQSINDGVFRTSLTYYSPLINLRKSRLRNYVFLEAVYGINPPLSVSLTLQDRVRDIRGIDTFGKNLIAGRYESIWFSPLYFYGFRFAPFAYFDFGFIQENRFENFRDNFFSTFGLGLRMRNESLVFRTFELRVGYFPQVPKEINRISVSLSLSVPLLFGDFFRFKPNFVPYD